MDPATAKQQIAERVKQASKFLVTVNSNPTVDQLAACIGLTLLLNKMGKHATAVFSGKVPSTIEFLQPDKTLQKNTDALRDFIISLDKNKADKLRYKVEDDVVRIFITPYRTSLSQKDLMFSDGDFNVEAVLALGITQRTQIDAAITAHGRILHDATVISVNAGAAKAPDLGQINWADPAASSLSEMLVSISEAFGTGLIDSQIATAFLTGIVSETQRFSNKKTSPKVMTMSAQLMAAGANQQLIAEKLEPPPQQKPPEQPKPPPPPKPQPQQPLKPEGVIDVPHDDKPAEKANTQPGTTEIHIDEQGNLLTSRDIMPPSTVSATTEPENRHAFLGTTAQPPNQGYPAAAGEDAADWAAPYDLGSAAPTEQPVASRSDFNSSMPAVSPVSPQDYNSAPAPVAASPPVTPVQPAPMVDNARSAVEQAIDAAPFDPGFAPPVQALNAQTLDTEPVSYEAPAPVPDAAPPPAPSSDTPMLVLPTDNNAQSAAPAPAHNYSSDVAPAAPPPLPPPLTTASGAAVPNIPPQT